ncbi:small polypeptide DEVIL 4-like [Solanum dulcamara]|nr:small polypeptide DEVIL 4-like [Solanum dulcamara]
MMKKQLRLSKLRRMVKQQKGKLYIMRICITMLLCWDKTTTPRIYIWM